MLFSNTFARCSSCFLASSTCFWVPLTRRLILPGESAPIALPSIGTSIVIVPLPEAGDVVSSAFEEYIWAPVCFWICCINLPCRSTGCALTLLGLETFTGCWRIIRQASLDIRTGKLTTPPTWFATSIKACRVESRGPVASKETVPFGLSQNRTTALDLLLTSRTMSFKGFFDFSCDFEN